MNLCFMFWNWQVLRAEPMLSCWNNLLCLSSTIFSLSFFSGLIVRGWGFRIDRVLTLSHPCTADLFLLIIIIIIIIVSS